MISRPDAMCLEALRRGLIRVDTEAGRAWSVRFHGKELVCQNSGGYTVFTLHLDGERAQIKLHRLIWLAANGPILPGFLPDHRNRIKHDNRLENLRLVDSSGNSRNRRSYSGVDNPAARITPETVTKIRAAHPRKSYNRIARDYGVSKSLVAQIVRGELWT